MDHIWVFNGDVSSFPSGIFLEKENALEWVENNKLSGTLTKYPVNVPVYEWAVENNFFTPKREYQKNAKTIGNFSSAHLEHYHFIDGAMEE